MAKEGDYEKSSLWTLEREMIIVLITRFLVASPSTLWEDYFDNTSSGGTQIVLITRFLGGSSWSFPRLI